MNILEHLTMPNSRRIVFDFNILQKVMFPKIFVMKLREFMEILEKE